jgi:hypothetical protein
VSGLVLQARISFSRSSTWRRSSVRLFPVLPHLRSGSKPSGCPIRKDDQVGEEEPARKGLKNQPSDSFEEVKRAETDERMSKRIQKKREQKDQHKADL